MATGKEIRSKIKSVQNTQKITRAMQMVATSKMRKTQERMKRARPYALHIRRVMNHLAKVNDAAKKQTPFLRNSGLLLERNARLANKRVGIILITTDKGLCGGLNANSLKLFYNEIKSWLQVDCAVEVCALGHKGLNAVMRSNIALAGSAIGLGDIAKMAQIVGPISSLLNQFRSGTLDAVYVVYSKFINTMKQTASCEQLLPLVREHLDEDEAKLPWDYVYEPQDASVLLDELVRRYIEAVIFQCLNDNMASEQASRMVAMKAATDNALSAIDSLRLVYNKTRQAAITKELAEIVAGSAAV